MCLSNLTESILKMSFHVIFSKLEFRRIAYLKLITLCYYIAATL